MRGRKPKPTVLKDLHGSEEPRNPNEPIPLGDATDDPAECPPHFNADQRDAWEYAVRHSPPGMVKRIDTPVLEAWVVAHCLHRRATEQMTRSTLLVRSPNVEFPMQNPLIPIINRQALIMTKVASELGFTPVSRPRIQVTGALSGDSLSSRRAARGRDAAEQSIEAYLASSPSTAIH
jgi:P27 family predicted phage terminase small subunit